jgi:hypothetical protein
MALEAKAKAAQAKALEAFLGAWGPGDALEAHRLATLAREAWEALEAAQG